MIVLNPYNKGHGCLYMVNDDHVFDEVNQIYCGIKDMLNEDEKPINTFEQLIDLVNDNEYTIISRKKIFNYKLFIEK